MGWFRNLTRPRNAADDPLKERRLSLSDGLGWAGFFGAFGRNGKQVSMESALQVATVWACVKLTAQAVSGLPLQVFEKQRDGSRVRVEDDRLAEVLSEDPNADQTSLEFWESAVAWLLTRGNAYAEKVEVRDRLVALQPLPASHTRPVRDADGTLSYRYIDRGKSYDLPRDKVFHIKGFGFGGDLGLSPISYGVQSLSAAIATEEAAAQLFANGLQASGLLTSEQTLRPDQREQLRQIMRQYVGSGNAGKLMILEAGLKFEALSLNPEDAQMLETRRFQIEEICRWFGVPPMVIGHAAQGQTMWGSGVEQILITWLALGIDPLCDRIEARIRKQLLRGGSRRRYAEFNREALLQMDSKAKASFLSTMVQNGLMTRNEGRQKLNLSRAEAGDMLTAQTNLASLERIAEGVGQQTGARNEPGA